VPFHEDADLVLGATTTGRWSYAASKALDEFLALFLLEREKQPVIVVRFSTRSGPRQTGRYGMVLPNFVSERLMVSPSKSTATASSPAVSATFATTVEALLRLMPLDRAVGEVINIVNTEGSYHRKSLRNRQTPHGKPFLHRVRGLRQGL